MSEPMLEVEDLDVRYGTSQALFGVSLTVEPGTVLAVLGTNGAGKSTLARAVSGLVAPSAGRVRFEGRDVTGLSAHRIRKLGLTYIPEGRGIFPGLSVIDNLRMAVAQERRPDRPAPSTGPSIASPCSALAAASAPGACRAASSRCWRWPGRWPSRRSW